MKEKEMQLEVERQQVRMLEEQLQGYEVKRCSVYHSHFQHLDQRESIRMKDRQQVLERDLLEANKQKAQLICQVSRLQLELDAIVQGLSVSAKGEE